MNLEDKELQSIHDKLFDYEVELPENSWEQLAMRMPQERKRRAFPLWIRSVAALLIFALMATGSLYWWYNTSQNGIADDGELIADSVEPSASEIMVEPILDDEIIESKVLAAEELSMSGHLMANAPKAKPQKSITAAPVAATTSSETIEVEAFVEEQIIITEQLIEVKESSSPSKQLTIEEAQMLMQQKHDSLMMAIERGGDKEEDKAKKEKSTASQPWSVGLLAGLNPGVNVSSLSNTQPLANVGNTQKVMKMQNFTQVHHDFPVTVALQVGVNLVGNLDLQTGLSYTYLRSTFKSKMQGGSSESIREQSLNYLGIPVLLSYRFLNTKYVNLYASGGGMLEKGLVQENNAYIKSGNGDIYGQTKDRSDIDGVQWSLSANVGVAFRLYKGLHIYGEPGVTWYIPNEQDPQPASQRTVTPFNFNLQFGIRYNIN